jgi:copper(I)-binding protein
MKRVVPLLPLAALVLAACGSDDVVTIDGAWARTSAAGQTTGAIYFDLTVAADDTLVGADVPDSVADRAEIHEVVMAEMADADHADDAMEGEMGDGIDDSMDEMDDMAGSEDMDDGMDDGMDGMDGMDGAMVMQELTEGLALVAGETVTFEPGGYHVMLLDIAEPLEAGDEIELTLEFAEAGATTLTVEVAESAP